MSEHTTEIAEIAARSVHDYPVGFYCMGEPVRAPDADAIRKGVASALMGMYDPIEVDEVDYSGEAEVLAYGTTDDGLRVGFRVRIDQIEEVDW